MGPGDIGAIAHGPAVDADPTHLAQLHQLAEGVVDGGAADLGEDGRRPSVDLIGGEVHVLALEHLGQPGIKHLTDREAGDIGDKNPEFHLQDLREHIEAGDFPSWSLEI